MSYGDYVEQLTYLLFLKMADERSKPPYSQPNPIPHAYGWPELLRRDGDDLFDHYRDTLEELGKEKGMLALIFNKAQNKFQDPAKLRRLVVDLIDAKNWSVMGADVKIRRCAVGSDEHDVARNRETADSKASVPIVWLMRWRLTRAIALISCWPIHPLARKAARALKAPTVSDLRR